MYIIRCYIVYMHLLTHSVIISFTIGILYADLVVDNQFIEPVNWRSATITITVNRYPFGQVPQINVLTNLDF